MINLKGKRLKNPKVWEIGKIKVEKEKVTWAQKTVFTVQDQEINNYLFYQNLDQCINYLQICLFKKDNKPQKLIEAIYLKIWKTKGTEIIFVISLIYQLMNKLMNKNNLKDKVIHSLD